MGYPYGKTYLAQIQDDKEMCSVIRAAYYAYSYKYCKEHNKEDIDLTLEEQFELLAEAFEYGGVRGCTDDTWHFMGDILNELLGEEQ